MLYAWWNFCRLTLNFFVEMIEHTRQQREDRVLGFFFSRMNWDPPPPSPAGECVPPFGSGGGGGAHSLAGEGGGVPIRTRGQTLWYSRYTCTLWAEIKAIYSWCYLGSILFVTYFMLERVGEKEPIELGGGGGGRGGRMSEISAVYDQSWLNFSASYVII
jgi:hypothetical protein